MIEDGSGGMKNPLSANYALLASRSFLSNLLLNWVSSSPLISLLAVFTIMMLPLFMTELGFNDLGYLGLLISNPPSVFKLGGYYELA